MLGLKADRLEKQSGQSLVLPSMKSSDWMGYPVSARPQTKYSDGRP